jgi:hypothetical protein
MFSLALLAIASLFLPFATASPVAYRGISIPFGDPNKILCQLSILKKILCPPSHSSSDITKDTPLGTANGILDPQGAYRFSVKYASAARWAPSTVVTTWALPYAPSHAVFAQY